MDEKSNLHFFRRFLTACASLGIDATPMEGIEGDKYTEILGLENHLTTFAVCIGKHHEEDTNQLKFHAKKESRKIKLSLKYNFRFKKHILFLNKYSNYKKSSSRRK